LREILISDFALDKNKHLNIVTTNNIRMEIISLSHTRARAQSTAFRRTIYIFLQKLNQIKHKSLIIILEKQLIDKMLRV